MHRGVIGKFLTRRRYHTGRILPCTTRFAWRYCNAPASSVTCHEDRKAVRTGNEFTSEAIRDGIDLPFELGSHEGGCAGNSHRGCMPARGLNVRVSFGDIGFQIPCVLDQAREGFCVKMVYPVFVSCIRGFRIVAKDQGRTVAATGAGVELFSTREAN